MTKKHKNRKCAKSSRFTGNGLSKTAMIFKIATVACHELTIVELNKIKDINPRSIEGVFDEVFKFRDRDTAKFALSLLLK